MKFYTILSLVLAVFLGNALGQSLQNELSQSYAPIYETCPSGIQFIRPAKGLAPAERDWVQGRKRVAAFSFASYLERLGLQNFDVADYFDRLHSSNFSNVPTIGFAISGGGWTSALTGSGILRAMDDRFDAANDQGTGGLLQSLTYISGLSGGSFATVSFPAFDFPTVDDIVNSWFPEIDRLNGVTNSTPHASPPDQIFESIAEKAEAGFNVTFADFFGRVLGYEFLPGQNGGLNVTWSSIVNMTKFKHYEVPFPIIQLATIEPNNPQAFGVQIPTKNNTILEVTPLEFGAWNGSISSFTPTEWVGTYLDNGTAVNKSACVRGFDRASFIMGSSGDAFNLWYVQTESNGSVGGFAKRSQQPTKRSLAQKKSLSKRASFPPAILEEIVSTFNDTFGENVTESAYAIWPNPFAGLPSSSPFVQQEQDLLVVDGSESGQTIPLWGQIQPARSPNFIIAWDSSEDAMPYNWDNGTNLYNTYLAANASGIPFPIVPPATTMINKNYTLHPVFFGCNANLTTTKSLNSPIVLYLASAPYTAYTNFSYSQSSESRQQVEEILVNSFNLFTQANGTLDSNWASCIGCAAIDRSLTKVGLNRTAQCSQCFSRYCWDGSYDNRKPSMINPSLLLNSSETFEKWNSSNPF
ncbi:hypothetical protein L228DRAFT_266236 [Xylona heveae TC161]|uniref:Lysophospholipase n=1 Tax=Xylona heveae (strain CBS 132557 / TC161) TaxID=1328760 RepID=A0A165J657_XYLHT|nr:hypothetical protein L228DRAFT_266236 [Xylona heveae TC161]KZF25785.1 hypothetical protein L228DRAFT_266236 [Xylona heveae TC161]